MTKCSVDENALKLILSKVATVFRSYLKNKESMSTLKVNIAKVLGKLSASYELADINRIAEAIHRTSVRYGAADLNPDFFNVLNISNLIIAKLNNISIDNSAEASTENLTDTKFATRIYDVSREFLDNVYGLAKEVQNYVVNSTNRDLFNCLFVNRGFPDIPIGPVRSNIDLNNNIRLYQEYLLKKITAYLSYVVKNAPNLHTSKEIKELLRNPKLYIDNENSGILDLLSALSKAYLSSTNFNEDILRELFNSTEEVDKLKLEAYNAKVILDHFDTYLCWQLGDKIEIQDFNQKTGQDKYQIAGKTAKVYTTWRISENIFVEDEADMVTKMAITTTPLIKWQSDIPVNNRFLTFLDYTYIIAKIKDLAYNENIIRTEFNQNFIDNHRDFWDSLSRETLDFLKGKRLSTVINITRRNPRKYLNSVFEALSNKELYDILDLNFTRDELNKLWSISRGIFNGPSSIYDLTRSNKDNDYYSYIAETTDTIFKVKYILYYKNEDGVITVRSLIDLSVNNIRRGIELTINTRNSRRTIKDYDSVMKELNLYPNSTQDFKSILFRIPNTDVDVKVVASSGSVMFTRGNRPIIDFLQLWKDDNIKAFVSNVLKLNLDNSFLLELYDIEKGWSNLSKDLLSFASRIILNLYVSNKIVKDLYDEKVVQLIYGRNAPKYSYQLSELELVHGNDIRTLRNMAIAKANVLGITTSSSLKDSSGNGQSAYTLSRLFGSLLAQYDLQEKLPESATKGFVLLQDPGLFEGVYTFKEFYDLLKESKESTDMTVSEMAYAGLVNDFIKGFIYPLEEQDLVGSGHVLFLTSVNSDKGTVGKMRVNLNKEYNGTPYIKLSQSELKEVIAELFGLFYTNMYNSITSDWKRLLEFIQAKGINIPEFDFINNFLEFNKYFLVNIKELSKYGKNPSQFVKYFALEYNKVNRLKPLALIDQVHYINNKGNLSTNLVIISQIARFNPSFIKDSSILRNYPTAEDFWALLDKEVLKVLLKSNFKVNTSKEELPEFKYLRNNYKDWIDASGNLILAKINGINITSKRDIIRITDKKVNDFIDSNKIILNPIIGQYNLLDYLFTQEFMNSSVGSFIAHPAKGSYSNIIEIEAAQFLAQHKRNVSLTAAMHTFLLNTLNGISQDYNIATIEDIKDELGTITGLINTIKPFDGATFVNPFTVILENYSLGGAKAGITKKLFIHFKDARTGTGGIIKTAGFGLTNDLIRNSPFMLVMMRKMTNHVWLNEDGTPAIVDITKDYNNNPIVYNDIFFKKGNKFYQVIRINSLGHNTYSRIVLEVTKDGNPIGNPVEENPLPINTNYQLWQYFGGANSMVMEDNFLKLSNTSVENVVITINNTAGLDSEGNPILKSNVIETLDDIWQPLKHVDVHYVVTAGAIKQGAANINSITKYEDNDEEYDILKIHMYLSGILLDKEHHADNAKLSLMTLVMSACAAKGYTFELASKLYQALRTATDVNTLDYLGAVRKLFNEESLKNLQEIVIETILKSLSRDNNDSFAKTMANELILQAREGTKILFSEVMLPLSDNMIYAKMLSTISSYLTNTGIKLSIPGVLSVLTPSHNIFKLYAERKYESFANPELELAELLAQLVPVYDSLYQYSPDMLEFAGMRILYVLENSLISDTDNLPVAARNPHDGTILIDDTLLRRKYELKAWKNSRNSKPLDRDFTSYDEWKKFVLLHEAMHNLYPRLEGESKFDYETRINEQALKRFDNNISNLELGRTYFITRNIPIDIEMDEGILLTFETKTEKRLIRTPKEYYELKDSIEKGEVVSVIENIVDGRDLAGYNVRFSSDTGERFQLWDIDSANILFSLNELKEPDPQRLLELYEFFTGRSTVITYENYDLALNNLKLRVNRALLKDLENLSYSTPDTLLLYLNLLNTKEETTEWYNKYAEWVNIKLGRNHGNLLYIGGQFIRVNSENFNQVHERVSELLDKTTKVRINGNYLTIDKSSIITLAYEVIMPKIFKTKFGLDEFDDLFTIKNDPDFFIKLWVKNQATKVNNNLYTVELKVSNGKHYYLLTKNQVRHSGLTKIEPLKLYQDGKIYRLDSKNNIMYEITSDTEIFLDALGNEVIVTDDLKFYIDNLHYDSIRLSDRLINYPSLVREILNTCKTSKNRIAKLYRRYVLSEGTNNESILRLNTLYNSIEAIDSPVIKQCRAKHTSFLKSLDIVAARIPSLSMQSFMPMKIVAFDNPDINTAYVSTYLILLLGSDY